MQVSSFSHCKGQAYSWYSGKLYLFEKKLRLNILCWWSKLPTVQFMPVFYNGAAVCWKQNICLPFILIQTRYLNICIGISVLWTSLPISFNSVLMRSLSLVIYGPLHVCCKPIGIGFYLALFSNFCFFVDTSHTGWSTSKKWQHASQDRGHGKTSEIRFRAYCCHGNRRCTKSPTIIQQAIMPPVTI